jgi:integrase
VRVVIQGKGGHEYFSEIPTGLYVELREQCAQDPPLPLNRNQLYRLVRRAGRRVGIDNLSPHCLRHACGTHLARAGVNIHMIQEHLGHASILTTQQYLDMLPNDTIVRTLERAVAR